MAGDWIKMRVDLSEDPAVIAMAQALQIDEFGVVGRLHKLWSWADKHCSSGHAKSVTFVWINRYIGLAGFAESMAAESWLRVSTGGVEFPKFDRHNGKSAKTRAEASERKRIERKNTTAVADLSQEKCDNPTTREEKRREDSKPPLSPKGEKQRSICLRTFLDECEKKSVRPVRDYAPLWDYVDSIGLDRDWVALAWAEFCRQMLPGGVSETKRQADWRKAFRNYIEKNYLKLWAIGPDGTFFLTTAGKTAQLAHDAKAAA